nr:dihydropteroate synthase [Phytoactinopolyspora halophila]
MPSEAPRLRLGPAKFGPDVFAVMGIVNRTPDSFYDNGATYGFDRAWDRVEQMIAEGADIVDVGGVKAGTGPAVSENEEIERTADLVTAIRDRYPDVVVSVDTYRSRVADVLCEAGAHLVNDAWAGSDPELATVAARWDAGLVCSHTGGHPPRTDPRGVVYDDVMADVVAGTTGLAEAALAAGVRRDGILLDPTHDFGKTTYHSLDVSRRLDELVATGWPVLVSMSRKDFVGETLDLPVEERLNGTLAATAIAAWQGARVFRAHDVRATREVLDMVAAIKGHAPPRAPRRGLS